jgi:tRNA (cmo5U34)-methyltransferase
MKDTIFDKPYKNINDFVFDAQVANVFENMVNRSVPGYQTMLEMMPLFAQTYAQKNSNIYDLGCSLGAVSLAIDLAKVEDTKIISVDNSPEMIKKCQKNLSNLKNNQIICADINDLKIENASIVILNLTIQFISPEKRQQLINKIYQGLNQNGILILSEKVHFENTKEHSIQNKLQINFKLANGYSELAVAQKRQALENILKTDNINVHLERLDKAGFKQSFSWFQCFNFVSLFAVK